MRQQHLDNLCQSYGIKAIQRPNLLGFMYVEYEPPTIEIPSIDDNISGVYPNSQSKYLVGLHEIGHVHHGHTQGIPPYDNLRFYYDNGVLHSEAQAWNFALDHCQESIDIVTSEFMVACLKSYLNGAMAVGDAIVSRGGTTAAANIPFRFDKPDDYFWDTLVRLRNAYQISYKYQ